MSDTDTPREAQPQQQQGPFHHLAQELMRSADIQAIASHLQAEEQFRHLFEAVPDAFVLIGKDGKIVLVNSQAETMFGYPREELLNQPVEILLPERFRTVHREHRLHYFSTPRTRPMGAALQLFGQHKNGKEFPVDVGLSPLPTKDGLLVVSAIRDVTLRKTAEQQRAEFVTMLAHDIKNPLWVILGYAQLLLDKARERQAADDEDILQRIESSALTIHSLVTNYLDLSRIEAGELSLEKTSLVLNDVLARVEQQYGAEAQRRRITLHFAVQPEKLTIKGDALALERVFANLVHNAVKFTPEGGQVTIGTARHDGEIEVSIADTGPGIASEELSILFDKYRRSAATRNTQGTGLGLFIVKTLVEAHGGRVEVQSVVGQGTCFRVILPIGSLQEP